MKQSSGYPFGNQVMYLKLIKTKMSEIDLYTSPQLISIGIFCVLIGFCLGNIFQIQMRKNKNEDG